MSDQVVIWWTTDTDVKIVGEELSDCFPEYLRREWRSRVGRNGRGRLWIADEIERAVGPVEVWPWPDTPTADRCAKMAGIVVFATDVRLLADNDIPGELTNVFLQKVSLPSRSGT